MLEFTSLAIYAGALFLLACALFYALEAFWAVCLWVYGLRTIFKVHRDDVSEAVTLDRALSPFPNPVRDRNGNLRAPPT